jgi:hypothetical protein
MKRVACIDTCRVHSPVRLHRTHHHHEPKELLLLEAATAIKASKRTIQGSPCHQQSRASFVLLFERIPSTRALECILFRCGSCDKSFKVRSRRRVLFVCVRGSGKIQQWLWWCHAYKAWLLLTLSHSLTRGLPQEFSSRMHWSVVDFGFQPQLA